MKILLKHFNEILEGKIDPPEIQSLTAKQLLRAVIDYQVRMSTELNLHEVECNGDCIKINVPKEKN